MKTCKQLAIEWGLTERNINYLCKAGKINGAIKVGRSWKIPDDAKKPVDGRLSSRKYVKKASREGMKSLPIGISDYVRAQADYYYVDKTELTTVTLIYDVYYDFGIIGVLVFACILGAVCFFLVEKLREMKNPMGYLFYGQMAIYMMLSFFTTWFSNPTTWFYFLVTAVLTFYCSVSRR